MTTTTTTTTSPLPFAARPRPRSRSEHYDLVVVGARCAGAATALLAARAGLRALVVDRTPYGSDTLSTHALMRGGVLQLQRWGLLDQVVAAGTPPIRSTTLYYGDDDPIAVAIKPSFGVDALYAPRRTVLDPILVDAALEAGAEVRFGVTVTDLLTDRTGRVTGIEGRDRDDRAVRATAGLTVGADGVRSTVARRVGAPVERSGTGASAIVYGHFAGVPASGYEWIYRPGVTAGLVPTNTGQTCVFVGTTPARFRAEVAPHVGAGFRALLAEASPEAAERVLRRGVLAERLRSFPGQAGYFRRAFGPGWALVGDAGYFKDPLTSHGITDALRDAELLVRAVERAARGLEPEPVALAGYQQARDELSGRLFTTADEVASYGWDLDRIRTLGRDLAAAMTDEVEALSALDAARPLADAVAS